ncbi:MAG TPA: hypothetical protein VIK28_04200 [Sedimentisphaerales bacterium]
MDGTNLWTVEAGSVVIINNATAWSRKVTATSRYSEAIKTKTVSNVLYYTQETRREIAEIHDMISKTMSRIEELEK